MKNIILCLDGTWDKPSQSMDDKDEENENTNVFRLYELLEKNDLQSTYYDTGVEQHGTNISLEAYPGQDFQKI